MPSWMTADQRGRGLYADYLFNAIAGNWERKRPIWVMLMVNALTETDIKSRGIPVLDLFLAQEAMRMNKRTGAVERVEEQCMPLNGLNFTQVSNHSVGTSFSINSWRNSSLHFDLDCNFLLWNRCNFTWTTFILAEATTPIPQIAMHARHSQTKFQKKGAVPGDLMRCLKGVGTKGESLASSPCNSSIKLTSLC